MADEVLSATADPEQLSFFGLHHWLGEVSALLERVDEAGLAKAPNSEESKLIDQKDEIIDSQSRLRRSMGARLEDPDITKRERPLAQEFLRQQISKLEKGSAAAGPAAEKKAARAIEKLSQILEELGKKKAAAETADVQEIEATLKAADAEWKEVAPLYKKWEAGRHTFKNNDDLQAMRRKYETAKKTRESCPDRLQKALCCSREGKALAKPVAATGPAPGWFSASAPRKAAIAARPTATARLSRPNVWGSAVMSFAQRLRTEKSQDDDEEDEGDDAQPAVAEVPRPAPPPPPVRAKAAPPLPANADGFKAVKPGSGIRPAPKPAPQRPASDSEEEDEGQAEANRQQPTYNASAKKKGKDVKSKLTKKQKREARGEDEKEEEDDDDDEVAAPTQAKPSPSAWAATVENAFSESVVQELFQSTTWRLPEDEASAEERLGDLSQRLALLSPLGLLLPLEWKEFASLEVDGGPRRTSRRGTSPWITRIEKNMSFLAHYVTLLFVACLLHALSHFGLLLLAMLLQVGLILAPPDFPYLRSPARVLLLQVAHLLLWLFFIRSLWQLHFFVKCFAVLLIGGHSYIVLPLGEAKND